MKESHHHQFRSQIQTTSTSTPKLRLLHRTSKTELGNLELASWETSQVTIPFTLTLFIWKVVNQHWILQGTFLPPLCLRPMIEKTSMMPVAPPYLQDRTRKLGVSIMGNKSGDNIVDPDSPCMESCMPNIRYCKEVSLPPSCLRPMFEKISKRPVAPPYLQERTRKLGVGIVGNQSGNDYCLDIPNNENFYTKSRSTRYCKKPVFYPYVTNHEKPEEANVCCDSTVPPRRTKETWSQHRGKSYR